MIRYIQVLAVLILLSAVSCRHESNRTQFKAIGITQIASHPSLDQVREGIVSGLAESGWQDNRNIRILFKNANRDPALALPIAQSFVTDRVDVIVPITTQSTLAARSATASIPIVFAGVTDPVGVGLVSDLNHPGGNITGTSDHWPFEKQLQLFKTLLPSMRKMGMLYSPSDTVSAVAVTELRRLAPQYNIELVTVPVSTTQDLYSSARILYKQVDAVYTGLDTLVVENLESVLRAAHEAHKPVLAGDVGTVERGGLATYGIDMHALGRATAVMIDKVLRGEQPGNIPVRIVSDGQAILNRSVLQELGITVPQDVNRDAIYVSTAVSR
jgi:putative ABC transport system substrate-binding protein